MGTLDDFFLGPTRGMLPAGKQNEYKEKRGSNVAVSGGFHGRVECSQVRGNGSHRGSDTWATGPGCSGCARLCAVSIE